MIRVEHDWWKTLFDEVYLVTDAPFVCNPVLTKREVDVIENTLGLTRSAHSGCVWRPGAACLGAGAARLSAPHGPGLFRIFARPGALGSRRLGCQRDLLSGGRQGHAAPHCWF